MWQGIIQGAIILDVAGNDTRSYYHGCTREWYKGLLSWMWQGMVQGAIILDVAGNGTRRYYPGCGREWYRELCVHPSLNLTMRSDKSEQGLFY